MGKSGGKSASGARSPFNSKSAPKSLRKSQRLISLISQNDQKSASSQCQSIASCGWKPIRRLSFEPAVNQGGQTIRGLSGSALLNSPRSVLGSARDVNYPKL